MTRPIRLGAVDYLNARPLVYGLSRYPERVSLRFDSPAECARLLAAGEIDLGMVPSITYVDRPGDRIVPGVCIGSDGPVASVALFARKPIREVQSVAIDTSSRTSVALTRILCARRFEIAPVLKPHAPDLPSMLASADAALLIGDPALFADPHALSAEKIDLGAEWTSMTGLPFVWAFWSGPANTASAEVVTLLHEAAGAGVANFDAIADAQFDDPVRRTIGRRYLRENLMFRLDERAERGLRTYYKEAASAGVTPREPDLAFFSTYAVT